jgi:hypothetical protein
MTLDIAETIIPITRFKREINRLVRLFASEKLHKVVVTRRGVKILYALSPELSEIVKDKQDVVRENVQHQNQDS